MEILTDSVLPDCSVCGAKVAVEVDDSGQAVEVCQGCNLAQPAYRRIDPATIRQAVRRVAREAKRHRLLGPDCKRRKHKLCQASRCGCLCHGEAS